MFMVTEQRFGFVQAMCQTSQPMNSQFMDGIVHNDGPKLWVCAGNVSDFAAHELQHLFHILTTGVYPTIAVTDARCGGSLVSISKKHLWSLFSLDRLVQHIHERERERQTERNVSVGLSVFAVF